jgi:4-amino-4-deoxy-L-arabinose transferase-like glycosyltransferase
LRHTESLSKSWLIVPLLFLYLTYLGRVGFLGPDEPRYASIGVAMAHSGDWITPRLDGSPWFEKPPLLYWMTGVATRLHFRDEWAARLPVALVSLAFLIFFYGTLEREFSARVAALGTAILATSAGWLSYSFASLPDLPMSAALVAAMFIALFDTRPRMGSRQFDLRPDSRRFRSAPFSLAQPGYVAGALLGLAILAKGFVPLVLFAPVFLIARGKRWRMLVACVVVAAPWYLLCAARNGHAFWDEFFWKHHVARFLTPDLQHVQPFWYYVPVLLAGLFPWTPLALLAARRKTWDDERVLFLALWLLLGLVFFSFSQNKLPGYVLPLMPALAVILAVAADRAPGRFFNGAWGMAASVLLLVSLPVIAGILPDALMVGLRRTHFDLKVGIMPVLLAMLAGAVTGLLMWSGKSQAAALAAVLAITIGVTWFKLHTFPILETQVSVRAFWRSNGAEVSNACIDPAVRRMWAYGLNYYAPRPLPGCTANPAAFRIEEVQGRLAILPRMR